MSGEQKKNQDKIEANNLLEEASEILEKCIQCGMCKALCPVFKVLREEQFSPRGKAIMLSDKALDKVVFECNLCKACEQKCPLNIKVCDAILKAREASVAKGQGLKSNEEMIENIRQTGNPFGNDVEKSKEKLYCC
jgi:glycolate oxidase iron-sulfur subunit